MGNDHLLHALEQAGITSEQLAELVGVDPRSARRWLSGVTPRVRQQAKIASALNADRFDL